MTYLKDIIVEIVTYFFLFSQHSKCYCISCFTYLKLIVFTGRVKYFQYLENLMKVLNHRQRKLKTGKKKMETYQI